MINHPGYSCPRSERLHGGDPSNGDLLYLILLLSLIAFNQSQARTSSLIATFHIKSDAEVTSRCSGEATGSPHANRHFFLNPLHGVAQEPVPYSKAEVNKLLIAAHYLFLQIKFSWNTAVLTSLHIVYGCFRATMA